ncbi:MAG: PEP-CTERM sorting domain-containing protein [Planctomycetaceae bacterium]
MSLIGRACVLVTALVACSQFAFAITVGTTDTFTGSLDNWQKGISNPTYLSVVASGGPAGAGDSYMQSVADGGGSFGKLTVFNQSQWDSNYVTDGVTSIRTDLLNSGTGALQIRLGLRNSAGSGFISTTPFLLGTGSGWQTAEFPVTEAALTTVGSPGSYSSFLSSGFALRILHATTTGNLNGTTVVGTLGVDNVTAVPEPSAVFLAGLGGVGLVAAASRLGRSRRS